MWLPGHTGSVENGWAADTAATHSINVRVKTEKLGVQRMEILVPTIQDALSLKPKMTVLKKIYIFIYICIIFDFNIMNLN